MFSEAAARLAGLAGALFGWRPNDFWQATPAELAAVVEALAGAGAAPMTRDELARLEERFSDG